MVRIKMNCKRGAARERSVPSGIAKEKENVGIGEDSHLLNITPPFSISRVCNEARRGRRLISMGAYGGVSSALEILQISSTSSHRIHMY